MIKLTVRIRSFNRPRKFVGYCDDTMEATRRVTDSAFQHVDGCLTIPTKPYVGSPTISIANREIISIDLQEIKDDGVKAPSIHERPV